MLVKNYQNEIVTTRAQKIRVRMTELIFVTGGARSGKSSFALEKARELGGDTVTFVATAERSDDEMMDRIAHHQLERPSAWKTIEAPREVLIADLKSKVVLLDCLSLFVSNLLLDGLDESVILERTQNILDSKTQTLIVVSNEVGMGLVPEYPLGRQFRDVLGRANQLVARASTQAFFLVSGIPLRLK
jgi:adenosylcobinamide kinase / adenosylcobinamide-phosphate guanylyltransferase